MKRIHRVELIMTAISLLTTFSHAFTPKLTKCNSIYVQYTHLRYKKFSIYPIQHIRKYHDDGPRNNYHRYRMQMSKLYETSSDHECNRGFEAAQQAVTLLAQRNKTWKRLAPIVELATLKSKEEDNESSRTIADIGCDHGLLSIALASSTSFRKVIGTDVSKNALENGALAFYEKVEEVLKRNEDGYLSSLPIEFRYGDGLQPLNEGEADSICIAGMGVSTMLQILDQENTDSRYKGKYLDYIETQSLFLQPPTSRPRKLMELYIEVQGKGFRLASERIMKLKKRWYITSHFDRILEHEDCTDVLLPGHYLMHSQNSEQQKIFDEYIDHHLLWINKDLDRNGELHELDARWRNHAITK